MTNLDIRLCGKQQLSTLKAAKGPFIYNFEKMGVSTHESRSPHHFEE